MGLDTRIGIVCWLVGTIILCVTESELGGFFAGSFVGMSSICIWWKVSADA